jgi:hypothetical protein
MLQTAMFDHVIREGNIDLDDLLACPGTGVGDIHGEPENWFVQEWIAARSAACGGWGLFVVVALWIGIIARVGSREGSEIGVYVFGDNVKPGWYHGFGWRFRWVVVDGWFVFIFRT